MEESSQDRYLTKRQTFPLVQADIFTYISALITWADFSIALPYIITHNIKKRILFLIIFTHLVFTVQLLREKVHLCMWKELVNDQAVYTLADSVK